MIVYLVTNNVNGKQYVGQTRQDLKHYLYRQGWAAKYRRSKPKLYAAIRKHGIKNFSIEILVDCETQAHLDFLEILFICALKTQLYGYNIADGGGGRPGIPPWNKGKKGAQPCWSKGLTGLKGRYNKVITWGDKISATMKARGIKPSKAAQIAGGKFSTRSRFLQGLA